VLAGWPRNRRSASGTPSTMPRAIIWRPLSASRRKANGRLCDALLPVLHLLGWSYGYAPDPRWPSLSASIAFAQIVGPRGLRDDASVHLGLTLIAPHTHYSFTLASGHRALSGSERHCVMADLGQTFAPRPPGSLILHESGIGHAMETSGDPLLALYTWRGDLTTAPVYVEE